MKTNNRFCYKAPVADVSSMDLFASIMVTSSVDGSSSENFQDESEFTPIW